MSNVTAIANITAQAPYLSDGVWSALQGVLHNLPASAKISDGLTLYSSVAQSSVNANIKSSAGKLYAVIVQSRGAAGYVTLYNTATTGTTGTTPDFGIGITATSAQTFCAAISGTGNGTSPNWSSGIAIGIATTMTGTTALATLPLVYILYE